MFKWKFLVFLLIVALIGENIWIYGRSDFSNPDQGKQQHQTPLPQTGPPAPGKAVDPQLASLQNEMQQIQESEKKWGWPKLEDLGVWAGIASLVATVLLAAGGILLGHAYIADITKKILSANNLLMTGRIQSSLAMLALSLQWNENAGYTRNAAIDLEDLIFLKNCMALEAFDSFDRLKEEDGDNNHLSKRYRLACMNNQLLSYALANNREKYATKAARLFFDWQEEIPAKSRRPSLYRLTEIWVTATYPESILDLDDDKTKYKEQLTKLQKEVAKLAKDKETNPTEISSLQTRLQEALTRLT